jgi:PmbA protein
MIKEKVCIREKQIGLTVTNGKVSAVLRSNITKTGVRIYKDGCLGIAGAIGAHDENELAARAEKMIQFKLPYECVPAKEVKRSMDLSGVLCAADEEFVEMSGRVLEELGKRYPKFMFSNKMELVETQESLTNDAGLELTQKDRYIKIVLLIKHRDSKNLADGAGVMVSRTMDFNEIVRQMSRTCESYEEKADFSEKGERIPVVLLGLHEEFLMKFLTDLRGDVYGSGASLFSGKIGEKLFSDDFSLIVNRDAEKSFNTFFDGEGTLLQGDRFALIENGVLRAPYTSKRMAAQYHLPVTGSASMGYYSAPDATVAGISAARGNKTIKELLGGRKAIFAVQAAGGDFTPQGEYASPIQVAYLFDGEKTFGRLPQLSMSSNVGDMFGRGFIGASRDGDYPGSPFGYLAVEMDVKKIDGWL